MSMSDKPSTALTTKVSKKDQYYTSEEYNDAVDEIPINLDKSLATLLKIANTPSKTDQDKAQLSRMKEEAIYHVLNIYLKQKKDFDAVAAFFTQIRPFFDEISKPRAAKIIRTFIDIVVDSNLTDLDFIIKLVSGAVEWAASEKRTFLRQRLHAKLAQLYMSNGQYRDSLALIKKLMREIKKVDDKPLIVDIQLIEAQIYFKLRNYPKSRGALTYARATATGFYCPPLTTAQIEQQAGMLSCREKDYATAESYFHEATDNFLIVNRLEDSIISFKYGLFCKILNNQAGEVTATIQQRGTQFINDHIKAMEELAVVYQARQYKALDELLTKYKTQLVDDTLIFDQLELLKSNLLENSIKRIVEAYTRVDLQRVAELLELPIELIDSKISQLILDDKLSAMIDHQYGDLLVIQQHKPDDLLKESMVVLKSMNPLVDKLASRVNRLVNVDTPTEAATSTAVAVEADKDTKMKD